MSMPAMAHHSFAMFDSTQTMTATGTVTRFDWLNPHTWLYVSTTDENGSEVIWGLEGAGTSWMVSAGWGPDTVRPGDRIVIAFHPMRDGTNGGQLLTVRLPDGTELCSGQGCRETPGGES
jgi:hypothetical protein